MKRWLCVLLCLPMIACAAFAEDASTGKTDGSKWTLYESPFGYSFCYPESALWVSEEEYFLGSREEGPAPVVFLRSRTAPETDGYLFCCEGRLPESWQADADEPGYSLSYPYDYCRFTGSGRVFEMLAVRVDAEEYTFQLMYREGDPEGLGELFREVVNTLEFSQ